MSELFTKVSERVGNVSGSLLREEEVAALLPALKRQGNHGAELAVILEMGGFDRCGAVSRTEWERFFELHALPETMRGYESAVTRFEVVLLQRHLGGKPTALPDGWAKVPSQSIPGEWAFEHRALGKRVRTMALVHAEIAKSAAAAPLPEAPPSFKVIPDRQDRLGQSAFSYYDPVTDALYKDVEQAWNAYRSRQMSSLPSGGFLALCDQPPLLALCDKSAAFAPSTRRDRTDARNASRRSASRRRRQSQRRTQAEVPEPGADGKFIDREFPPCEASLGEGRSGRCFLDEVRRAATRWVRLSDLMRMNGWLPEGAPVMIWEEISPQGLVQGQIGNCWFIASVAALAEFPSVLKRLFVEADPEGGRYVVRLYDMARAAWEEVEVDDYVPCVYEEDYSAVPWVIGPSGQKEYKYTDTHEVDGTKKVPMRWLPHFAKPVRNETWAPILEKAMAKFVGRYSWIAGGNEPFALTALTGMPLVYCLVRPGVDEAGSAAVEGSWENCGAQYVSRENTAMGYAKIDDRVLCDDEMWERLVDYDVRNYAMTASMVKFRRPDTMRGFFRRDGLVLGHAYSVISCQDVKLNLKPQYRVIQWTDDQGDTSGFEFAGTKAYAMCNGAYFQPEGEAHIVEISRLGCEDELRFVDSGGSVMHCRCPREKCEDVLGLWAAFSARSVRLVLLRNPHGESECLAEGVLTPGWNGDWCDGSRLWELHPEVAQEVGYEPLNDGLFWMSWDDFRVSFDKLCVLPKSMAEPRAASAFGRRLEQKREVCLGIAKMADTGMMKDILQASQVFDPFLMLPAFMDDGSLTTRLRWEATKPGRLQAYLDVNRASGNAAGHDACLAKIRELGLESALGANASI